MHYISAIKKVFIKKVRKVKKQISTRRRMHAIKKFGTFDSKELFTHCREIGIRQNDILLVHCSMDNLFTYSGSLTELLQVLQELVAPKGTLLMPALSTNMFMTPTRPFDVQRETTYTGIIPELFRRMSDVIRSLHPRHSLCALGPMAHELTAGHEDCVYADGANSPWDRLRLVGAKGLNLGLRPGVSLTFQHWIEDIEPEKYPLPIHEGPLECLLINAKGEHIVKPFYRRTSKYKAREIWFGKKFSEQAVFFSRLRGVPISCYNYSTLSKELVSLRDRGIILCR